MTDRHPIYQRFNEAGISASPPAESLKGLFVSYEQNHDAQTHQVMKIAYANLVRIAGKRLRESGSPHIFSILAAPLAVLAPYQQNECFFDFALRKVSEQGHDMAERFLATLKEAYQQNNPWLKEWIKEKENQLLIDSLQPAPFRPDGRHEHVLLRYGEYFANPGKPTDSEIERILNGMREGIRSSKQSGADRKWSEEDYGGLLCQLLMQGNQRSFFYHTLALWTLLTIQREPHADNLVRRLVAYSCREAMAARTPKNDLIRAMDDLTLTARDMNQPHLARLLGRLTPIIVAELVQSSDRPTPDGLALK